MAESYTEQHHRICAYGRPTHVNKAGFGEKKGAMLNLGALSYLGALATTPEIALAGSSPERSWGSQLFGWLPDR